MVVLDIKMFCMDGMDLFQCFCQKILMLVIFLILKDDEIDEILGLCMGVDDYVKKLFSQWLLVEWIWLLLWCQDVILGEDIFEIEEIKVIECGDLVMDLLCYLVLWKGKDVFLIVIEFLLLQVLVQCFGFVKLCDQLMDVVYDDQVYVDDCMIDSYIKCLWKKMCQVDEEFNVIEMLYGIGYCYNED